MDQFASFDTLKLPVTYPLRVFFAGRLLKSKGVTEFLNIAEKFNSYPSLEFSIYGAVDQHNPDSFSKTK